MPGMNIEQSRQFISHHFGRPVEEVDTEELESLYDEMMEQSKQTPYSEVQEQVMRAVNLELMNRRGT